MSYGDLARLPAAARAALLGENQMLRIAFWVLLSLVSMSASAQLYKWVDADGKVHYSDRPPPASAKQEQKLNIRNAPVPPPAAEESAATAKSYTEQELEFRKRKVEQEEAQKKAAAEAETDRQNCARAQEKLRLYQEGGRVYTIDAQGERQYLGDESRERGIVQAREEVAKYCK